MSEVNGLLRDARERIPSRVAPGECMSRGELANAVCGWLWETTGIDYELDGHYIAKLERGVVRWPGAAYRAGLRKVLNVATDNELGFSPGTRPGQGELEASISSMVGLEAEMVRTADESVSILPMAETSNVGELTVEQLHSDIERVSRQYLRVPTKELFLRSRAIRDRAFELLGGRQSPAQTRDLYSAAGWALTILGWMSVDLGRPDLAEIHTRTAWACADAADHNDLRAWVRATQHTTAFWQDDFSGAAEYAESGLRYAVGSSRLFLASALAVDLARAGRTEQARTALADAQRMSVPGHRPELSGFLLCTPARAQGLWSDAHLALGQARETLRWADHSATLFERATDAKRNAGAERMVRLQQVKAHLELGELDGALEALNAVLDIPIEFRVRPLIHRVGEIAAMSRTDRYTGVAAAAQLHVAARTFLRRPKPAPDKPKAKASA
ncbi:hypothetical protein [Kribbella sp. NPDC051770]|uniref:hypothetical protein n=1 Tax=Kribbella sp. NPDC051770 TaxID=3155413 RepID=UPI00343AB8D8